MNTRCLLLCLPKDKFLVYNKEVKEILNQDLINWNDLGSIIGMVVYASYAAALSCHYLVNFQLKLKPLNDNNPHRLQLSSNNELSDFELWKKILTKAHEGVFLNGLVCQLPTRTGF